MPLFNNRRMNAYDEEEEILQPIIPEPIPVKRETVQNVLQMKVVRPKKLNEATEIADSLKVGQTIVLNLDDLSDVNARRMLDYVAGVIYAVNGKIERPSDRTFLLTPKGVNVDTNDNK
ncbi:MAG: cell division protein SepF [Clostridia bacterium]|nr:cell division protein SepF [Clostridia bacterium]